MLTSVVIPFLALAGALIFFVVVVVPRIVSPDHDLMEYHEAWANMLGESIYGALNDERNEKRAKNNPYEIGFHQGKTTGLPATDEQVRKHYNMTDEQIKSYQEGRAAGVAKAVG